ncbi:MAG: discoidin domain-containing protein [Spirochaetales bacterium]|nr:discoidin domain-containing protein [Spirochaetales bacterium]
MKKTLLFLTVVMAAAFTGCMTAPEPEPLVDLIELDATAAVELPVVAASASAHEEAKGLVAEFAIDGDMETTWTASGKQHILLDLGAVKKVAYVEIAMKHGANRKYKLSMEGSVDGSTYFPVLNPTTSSGSTEDMEKYDSANAELQFLKINVAGNNENDWNNFYEVKIYGM